MVEKKEGAESVCNCGTKIFCRKKPKDNDPNYLQWQHEDGKAHYNYDFKTKTTTCNVSEDQQPTQQTIDSQSTISNFTPKLLSESELQIWTDIIEKIKEYHLVIKYNLENDPKIEKNGQLHGLLTNQSFIQLNAILQKKRDDSS